jgi:hypothetical protein
MSLGGDYVAWSEIFLACALVSLGGMATTLLAIYIAKVCLYTNAAYQDAMGWDTAPTLPAGSMCLMIGEQAKCGRKNQFLASCLILFMTEGRIGIKA